MGNNETFWVQVAGQRVTREMGAQSAANYAANIIKNDIKNGSPQRVIVYDLGGAPIDYDPASKTVGYPDDTHNYVEEWHYIAKAMMNALLQA